MKQGRTDRDWVVVTVMAFAAGGFFVWALMSGHPSKHHVASGPDWPAWIQAIGSLIGIGIAIAVPSWQRHQEVADQASDNAIRAKILAGAFWPAIRTYRASLQATLDFLPRTFDARKTLPEEGIPRPVEFDQFRLDPHLLGDLGTRVNDLIGSHGSSRNASLAIKNSENLSAQFVSKVQKDFPERIQLATELEDILSAWPR